MTSRPRWNPIEAPDGFRSAARLALGTTAGPPPAGGWVVRASDDHRGGNTATRQTVVMVALGLATSSITERHRRRGGQEMHRLVHPRAGLRAHGLWPTVSAADATCQEANALARATLGAGAPGRELLEESWAAAQLVTRDGRRLRVAGWPHAGDELPALVTPKAVA